MTTRQNQRKKGIKLISIIFVIGTIVFFILLDHSFKHSGILAQDTDFENAFANLVRSHESIIIILAIVAVGIIIGYYLRKPT